MQKDKYTEEQKYRMESKQFYNAIHYINLHFTYLLVNIRKTPLSHLWITEQTANHGWPQKYKLREKDYLSLRADCDDSAQISTLLSAT